VIEPGGPIRLVLVLHGDQLGQALEAGAGDLGDAGVRSGEPSLGVGADAGEQQVLLAPEQLTARAFLDPLLGRSPIDQDAESGEEDEERLAQHQPGAERSLRPERQLQADQQHRHGRRGVGGQGAGAEVASKENVRASRPAAPAARRSRRIGKGGVTGSAGARADSASGLFMAELKACRAGSNQGRR
jgi:hypothetical protein